MNFREFLFHVLRWRFPAPTCYATYVARTPSIQVSGGEGGRTFVTEEDQRTGQSSEEMETLPKVVADKLQDEDQNKAIGKVITEVLFEHPEMVVAAAERQLVRENQPNAPNVNPWALGVPLVVGSILVAATLFVQGYSALLWGYSALLPSEFVTGISLGTILIVFAVGYRALPTMYQLKARAESVRIHLKNRAQIIQMLAESQTQDDRPGPPKELGSRGGGAPFLG
jgi:hypothetical protein